MRVVFLTGVLLLACTKAKPQVDPNSTVRFVTAPVDGVVSQIMSAQVERSKAEKRRVLLYAGASWCEPCRHFHEAVDRGEFTGKIASLDLVAFDAQMDAERMLLSGYESQFIPLFALPGPEGKAAGKHIEGSQGGTTVDEWVRRLSTLLESQPLQ